MNYQVLIVLVPIVVFIALAILSQWKELSAEYGPSPIEQTLRQTNAELLWMGNSFWEVSSAIDDLSKQITNFGPLIKSESEWWKKGDSAIFHPESEQ